MLRQLSYRLVWQVICRTTYFIEHLHAVLGMLIHNYWHHSCDGRFDSQLKHNQFMSLSLISKNFSHSQWYQILHWSQQILCIFVSFELISNFSSTTFWQVTMDWLNYFLTKLQWLDCQQLCCQQSFEKNFEINSYFFPKCLIFSHNFDKLIFCSTNYKISLIWLRELYLWNNLCVIFMSFIHGNLTIIRWKERTFINIFLNEWITYIIRTLNFHNTFSMAFAIHNTARRGSNVSPVFM